MSVLYDAAGRITGRRMPDGSRHTFAYDPAGHRTLAHDPTGRYTSTFDARGLLATKTDPADKTVSYTVDSLGRRRAMLDPDGGRTTYTHDLAGRQTAQVNPLGHRTTFSYDQAHRTTSVQLGNGARTSYVHDPADRLTGLFNLDSAAAVLSSFTYTYDNVGNRTSVLEADAARVTWSYDPAYQLTAEHRTDAASWDGLTVNQWDDFGIDGWATLETTGAGGAFNITYTYDPLGNRLLVEDSASRTTSTYDAANQLLTSEDSTGTTTYSYDPVGNRQIKETPSAVSTYTWDPLARLSTVEQTAGDRATFTYNAAGQRVRREVTGDDRRIVYDRLKPLLETTPAGSTTLTYDYTHRDPFGELTARRDHTGSPEYQQHDAVGSAVNLTDATSSETDTYTHRAFGPLESHTGPSTTHQTYLARHGYHHDPETGLYHLNTRYYDPETGQFISADPIGFAGGDVNLRRYVRNVPLRYIDPDGLRILLRPHFRGKIMVEKVLAALTEICPCAVYSVSEYEAFITRQWAEEHKDRFRTRGDRIDNTGWFGVVAKKHDDKDKLRGGMDNFCNCFHLHPAGCTVVADLLSSKRTVIIEHSFNTMLGTLNPLGGFLPMEETDHYDAYGFLNWGPDVSAEQLASQYPGLPNANGILAHELVHAWMTDNFDDKPPKYERDVHQGTQGLDEDSKHEVGRPPGQAGYDVVSGMEWNEVYALRGEAQIIAEMVLADPTAYAQWKPRTEYEGDKLPEFTLEPGFHEDLDRSRRGEPVLEIDRRPAMMTLTGPMDLFKPPSDECKKRVQDPCGQAWGRLRNEWKGRPHTPG